ncbi:MAG: type 4a pilus biogenesis protein PilO [Actinomycetota bacterium]|nr:type 4a pilus biogenesis protein PilO [Actinomycetota bacterium]
MQVRTKNLVIGAIVVLLVGLLWYRVVYSPMESKASKAKTAAHQADATAAGLRRDLNSAASKKANGQGVSTDELLAAVPLDAAEASFLRSIDALRVSSGADWQSITPAPPTSAANIATITVGISVQGSEDQLARYVSGLSDLKRLFVLDTLTLTAAAGTGTPGSAPNATRGNVFTSGKMQMQISGRIFTQPAVVPSATGGTTGAAGTTTPGVGAPAPTGGATSPTPARSG